MKARGITLVRRAVGGWLLSVQHRRGGVADVALDLVAAHGFEEVPGILGRWNWLACAGVAGMGGY